jgi:hypothetical protein
LVGKHEGKKALGAADGNYRKGGFKGTSLKHEDGAESSDLHRSRNFLCQNDYYLLNKALFHVVMQLIKIFGWYLVRISARV